ncbi:biotin-dependent carboxyltransferase family protein [Paraburkholderia bonniea]|uniref:5-oxoprolinase subunit C family protein n=1 Tax=Paraburkholderia bonniea TaxID=2152891 RepID=UPI0012915A4C|nr:biotin-dependent carboxyltransferase family protein [Paraburkholderia bonniea]WJF90493.1 biotin-dependent carboxyltransferase family protein [Paraburkholderia bonniea]WJF93808.1 biotin-dependent carboxyltransferase family protein [Paraburkholderia bonniea]
MIDVIRSGLLSSVQDSGRHGYRHEGVAQSGALDALALEVGNRLVGNRPGTAGLEMTVGPIVLRFLRATRIALTGAEFGATLDGKPVYAWWSQPVQAGQELVLPAARYGMRSYLCVAGGIDVLPVLGSRSTDLAAGFGGLGGRALRDGDRLPVGSPGAQACINGFSPEAPAFGIKAPGWCNFTRQQEPLRHIWSAAAGSASAVEFRVLICPEYSHFTREAKHTFWSDEWLVTANSNRMGYRLEGQALQSSSQHELLSHAVLPGTIQVPPNGQPIILMSDAQTTGGYPKIGAVIQADLWKLAQVRLNRHIRFIPATPDEALEALRETQRYLKQIDAAIAHHRQRDLARAASVTA